VWSGEAFRKSVTALDGLRNVKQTRRESGGSGKKTKDTLDATRWKAPRPMAHHPGERRPQLQPHQHQDTDHYRETDGNGVNLPRMCFRGPVAMMVLRGHIHARAQRKVALSNRARY